jgi:hypothetical protein
MDIKESDWKVFRKLRELALERYCERVLNEVERLVQKKGAGSHERYLKLWGLLRKRDKTLGYAFDDPRRSKAIIQLANIVAEDLLTEDELNQFSEETRESIGGLRLLRNRYS